MASVIASARDAGISELCTRGTHRIAAQNLLPWKLLALTRARTQQAVLNSASIAASVITTSALITEVKEKDPYAGMPMPEDGMGGMPGM